jgi:hypothetical protein
LHKISDGTKTNVERSVTGVEGKQTIESFHTTARDE